MATPEMCVGNRRLFAVADQTGEIVCCPVSNNKMEPVYYSNKGAAKKVRDDLNKASSSTKFHVTRGPDHRLGVVRKGEE